MLKTCLKCLKQFFKQYSYGNIFDDYIFFFFQTTPPPPHPAGLVLTRPGYYTIPSSEALAERVDSDGNCYVEDFTIGREGYGSIFFPGTTNVANMNFDETGLFSLCIQCIGLFNNFTVSVNCILLLFQKIFRRFKIGKK